MKCSFCNRGIAPQATILYGVWSLCGPCWHKAMNNKLAGKIFCDSCKVYVIPYSSRKGKQSCPDCGRLL